MRAVVAVETRGTGWDDRNRPVILFETHVLYRKLTGAARRRGQGRHRLCRLAAQQERVLDEIGRINERLDRLAESHTLRVSLAAAPAPRLGRPRRGVGGDAGGLPARRRAGGAGRRDVQLRSDGMSVRDANFEVVGSAEDSEPAAPVRKRAIGRS